MKKSPQLEDGYLMIANEIVDVMMKFNFPAYHMRVLWAIWRKTYGFKKKEDWIPLSQLVEMTGIKKQHISRTLSELIARNVVTRSGYKIAFNKDYQGWTELPNRVTVTQRGKTVTQRGYHSNPIGGPQKNKLIKRKVGGKKTPPTMPSFFPTTQIKDRPELTIPYSEERSTFVVQQSEPYRLANYLFRQIIEHNGKSKYLSCSHREKEEKIEQWSKDIELLLRKDLAKMNGNKFQVVGEVIDWATKHDFWSSNILSGANLRAKWDTLTKQMSNRRA
jgi:phage replication O-like protein O